MTESAVKSGSKALETLLKQFWENVETVPGWVPLLACYELGVAYAPDTATFLGLSVTRHFEVCVGVLTFLSYQLGDAIDAPLFKGFEDSRLDKMLRMVRSPRTTLRGTYGLPKEGLYRVALSVLTAAGKYKGSL